MHILLPVNSEAAVPGEDVGGSEVDVILEAHQDVEVAKAGVYGDDGEREAHKGGSVVGGGGGLADAALARGHRHHPRRGTRQLRGGAAAMVAREDGAAGVWGGVGWRERRRSREREAREGGGRSCREAASERNEDEDSQPRLGVSRGKMVRSH
jgi:hypothetical protein